MSNNVLIVRGTQQKNKTARASAQQMQTFYCIENLIYCERQAISNIVQYRVRTDLSQYACNSDSTNSYFNLM